MLPSQVTTPPFTWNVNPSLPIFDFASLARMVAVEFRVAQADVRRAMAVLGAGCPINEGGRIRQRTVRQERTIRTSFFICKVVQSDRDFLIGCRVYNSHMPTDNLARRAFHHRSHGLHRRLLFARPGRERHRPTRRHRHRRARPLRDEPVHGEARPSTSGPFATSMASRSTRPAKRRPTPRASPTIASCWR